MVRAAAHSFCRQTLWLQYDERSNWYAALSNPVRKNRDLSEERIKRRCKLCGELRGPR